MDNKKIYWLRLRYSGFIVGCVWVNSGLIPRIGYHLCFLEGNPPSVSPWFSFCCHGDITDISVLTKTIKLSFIFGAETNLGVVILIKLRRIEPIS